MLVVKHIQLSGHEEVYLGHRVSYEPEYTSPNMAGLKGQACVWIHQDGNPAQRIDGGTVLVMNDLGKTVTRYDLGVSNVPLDDPGIELAAQAA